MALTHRLDVQQYNKRKALETPLKALIADIELTVAGLTIMVQQTPVNLSDFSAREQAIYQKLKTFIETY